MLLNCAMVHFKMSTTIKKIKKQWFVLLANSHFQHSGWFNDAMFLSYFMKTYLAVLFVRSDLNPSTIDHFHCTQIFQLIYMYLGSTTTPFTCVSCSVVKRHKIYKAKTQSNAIELICIRKILFANISPRNKLSRRTQMH